MEILIAEDDGREQRACGRGTSSRTSSSVLDPLKFHCRTARQRVTPTASFFLGMDGEHGSLRFDWNFMGGLDHP